MMPTQQQKIQNFLLNENQERRKNNLRDMKGTGRWALSIPHTHVFNKAWPLCLCDKCLYKQFPELNCADKETHNRAWLKFIKSPDSIPYRVQDKS